MFTRYESLTNTAPTHELHEWGELVQMLQHHTERTSKNDGPLWAPHTLKAGTTRANGNVVSLTAFVADLDGSNLTPTMRERLANFVWQAHTTFSHTIKSPHWRVIFPLEHPISASQWATQWLLFRDEFQKLTGLTIDPSCSDPARCYFLPAHRPGSEHQNIVSEGTKYLTPTTDTPHNALHNAYSTPADDFLIISPLAEYNATKKAVTRHAAMLKAQGRIITRQKHTADPQELHRLTNQLDELKKTFIHDVTNDATRTPSEAEKEWDDAARGSQKHANTIPTNTGTVTSTNIPNEFWEARPLLTQIRDEAHRALVSADVVLGCVLARAAALIHPSIKIPNYAARPAGSLNYFVAAIGPSGSSKSSAAAIAAQLIPNPLGERTWFGAPLGSGEGFIQSFLGNVETPNEKGKPLQTKTQTRDGVLFTLDEGEALDQLSGRNGATLMPVLRSAWNGETLGQTNASQETKRFLPAHHYRAALIISFQTAYTEELLKGAGAGTPQRFIWLHAIDPTIPHTITNRSAIQPLGFIPPPPHPRVFDETQFDQVLTIDVTILEELEAKRAAAGRGDIDIQESQSHRDLLMMKTAGILAILDNRLNITRTDWNLANILADTSANVWQNCVNYHTQTAAGREQSATTKFVRRAVTTENTLTANAVERCARTIAKKVWATSQPCTRRDLNHSLASRDRQLASVDEALEYAKNLDWIKSENDTFKPGKSRPM